MNVNGLSIEVLPTAAILKCLVLIKFVFSYCFWTKIMKKKLKELSREIYG